MPSWPEDDYLLQVGRVVYAIAAIEGLLIFDLSRMPSPAEGMSAESLAGRTTGQIGDALKERATSVLSNEWKAYLERGGQALIDLAPKRNAVFHARPATIDAAQRLYRWRLSPAETLPISFGYLNELQNEIELHEAELNNLRPPFAESPPSNE